jgi:hypothetical protein
MNLAEHLPGKRLLQPLNVPAIIDGRLWPLIGFRPFQKLLTRFVEQNVLPLPSSDARLTSENLSPFDGCQFSRNCPADFLTDSDLMWLPLVSEVQPPGRASQQQAVSTSWHEFYFRFN